MPTPDQSPVGTTETSCCFQPSLRDLLPPRHQFLVVKHRAILDSPAGAETARLFSKKNIHLQEGTSADAVTDPLARPRTACVRPWSSAKLEVEDAAGADAFVSGGDKSNGGRFAGCQLIVGGGRVRISFAARREGHLSLRRASSSRSRECSVLFYIPSKQTCSWGT